MRNFMILLISVVFLITNAGLAIAQQQYVFPQKGQSAEQQKKDEYECHSWAVKQTGFDPTAAAQAPPQQAAQQPAGAVAGRSQSRHQAQQQQAQAQQQASSQKSAKQQDYLRARGACLEGKGYSVK